MRRPVAQSDWREDLDSAFQKMDSQLADTRKPLCIESMDEALFEPGAHGAHEQAVQAGPNAAHADPPGLTNDLVDTIVDRVVKKLDAGPLPAELQKAIMNSAYQAVESIVMPVAAPVASDAGSSAASPEPPASEGRFLTVEWPRFSRRKRRST